MEKDIRYMNMLERFKYINKQKKEKYNVKPRSKNKD